MSISSVPGGISARLCIEDLCIDKHSIQKDASGKCSHGRHPTQDIVDSLHNDQQRGTVASFFRKLKWFVQRRRREDELREELQFHLDQETELHGEAGLPEQEARWAARRELGNLARLREDTRSAWGWP